MTNETKTNGTDLECMPDMDADTFIEALVIDFQDEIEKNTSEVVWQLLSDAYTSGFANGMKSRGAEKN